MPSQQPSKPTKAPHELTTEEAIRELFHPDVIEHAKRHAREGSVPRKKADLKSMNGS